ncbi:MAG: MBL fold metallo-hydrolase [Anaerolineae bacterium]|nr:MBL fold metallo-hydrolase [Anaerolineae bacterium]
MNIHYYNWSGISLQHADVLIGFDLYGEAVTWDILKNNQPKLFCVTHGHPEHAGSLRKFLEAPEARPYLENVHLISSPAVTAHINRRHILSPANVHGIKAGESITLNAIKITAFTWVHMPLLPPGFKHKVEYLLQLALHPFDLLRIGSQGLRLPMNAPQLGFHVRYPDGTTVLNYAEGVHRLTNPQEVQQVAQNLPADMLFFAVEPDDAEAIPRWVQMLAPKRVYLYEAHRPWRDLFHLPSIDLETYSHRLQSQFQAMVFHPLTQPGGTL